MGRTVWEVTKACLVFAVLHSLLAAEPVKRLAGRLAGDQKRNRVYRLAYNAQSLLSMGWVFWKVALLPDRELYRVPPPFSWLMRLAQVMSAGLTAWAVWAVGLPEMSGFGQLRGLLKGVDVGPEPEAQSPPLTDGGKMSTEGPFGFTRHPANWGLMGVFLFSPRMTLKGAVVAVLNTTYLLAGSLHEDWRMQRRYGEAFGRYKRAVPFLWPRARRAR